MTPQEETTRDERYEAFVENVREYTDFPEPLAEHVKKCLTSEVNLTIEQVEKWAENQKPFDNNEFGYGYEQALDDLLSFLTTLKK